MLDHLKDCLKAFKEGSPGSRFQEMHRRHAEKPKGFLVSVGFFAVGGFFLVAGVLLGFIPGVPGIVLGVLGAGVIATQNRVLAKWMDRAEFKCRQWGRQCRQWGRKWRQRWRRAREHH